MVVFSPSCSSTSPIVSFKNSPVTSVSLLPSYRHRVKANVSVESPSSSATDCGDDSPKVLLEVTELFAVIGESKQQILKGVNLTVRQGELHAVMGKNGSGKSTFAKVLVGHPDYEITGGSVSFKG